MAVRGRYHHHNPCLKVLLFILLLLLICGAIALIVLGALCLTGTAPQGVPQYCANIPYGGYLGLLIAGAVVAGIMLLVILCCCCLCCLE